MPRRKRTCLDCQHSYIATSLLGDGFECEHCARQTVETCRLVPTAHAFSSSWSPHMDAAAAECIHEEQPNKYAASETTVLRNVGNDSNDAMLDGPTSENDVTAPAAIKSADSHDDYDIEHDYDDRSEAADDLHCTQIIDIVDSDDKEEDKTEEDDDDDQPLVLLVQPPAKETPTYEEQTTANALESQPQKPMFVYDVDDDEEDDVDKERGRVDDDDADDDDNLLIAIGTNQNNDLSFCNVCGVSLTHISTGWKGRLHHIKRCAKKHQYTAKEASYNDDFELFEQNEVPVTSDNKVSTANPYAKPNAWHGNDASLAQAQSATNKLPSAFQTLMAGARRAAKIQKIKAMSPPAKGKRPQRRWGGRPAVDYSQRECPAYKKIFNTDFVVDGFHYAKSSLTQNYFLTHFHSDHYGGITKTWNVGTIYCSIGTANLVNQQLGVDRQYLHPLPMDTAVVIESRGRPITVTLIDANHCPGAVMFLFHVCSRNILHVGDFRWNRETMQAQLALKPFMNATERIDDLYLDTTYCDAKYDLPTQREAIQAAIEVATREVESAKQSKKKLLMLFGAYTIGKERIYLSVAASLGLKVYVDSRRMRILKSLDWKNDELSQLTTKASETCLWVVPLGHINMKKLEDYVTTRTGSFDRVVGFRPTGWSHTKKGSGIVTSNSRGQIAVHNVPYSEHSSFPELLDCLVNLRPKRIIPTVSVSKSQQQLDLLLKNWTR
ncbi:hypothetical protein MPSEU_000284300 [Mayamaea pseudoterrestris]|nr:hypothetical protein MPSEU_000284300 [Mayamaea pseudoterrestris]